MSRPNGVTGDARATLDAWRAQGADWLDPVRFRFIEALDRRAAGHRGAARRMLDERVSQLLDTYAGDLTRAAASASEAGSRGAPLQKTLQEPKNEPAAETLAGLTDRIARYRVAAQTDLVAAHGAPSLLAAYPDLPLLEYFRTLWSGLSTERQLQQSLEQVPGNAGPLNSSSLVHRSLSLMRELSPGYLQQFLSYVDTLSWMEQIGSGVIAERDASSRATTVKKSARGKAR